MQKNQKGFTIIELIVVIAIIAVLATIVMINVTSYIAKAKDASIKANMDSIYTAASVYYSDTTKGNGTFEDFLTTTDYTAPAAQIESQNGSATVVKFCNDTAHTCVEATATKFCISSPLASDSTKSYCMDSDGKKTESATAICANTGVCAD